MNSTTKIIFALTALALMVGSAQAATYTWNWGGDPAEWLDTDNWLDASVLPVAEAGADLVITADSTGNFADNPATAIGTVGTITTNAAARFNNFGNWNSTSQTGLIFDTGDASNAVISISGGTFQTYYTPQTLDVDVEVTGGKWVWRAYASGNRWGVRGTGGYIVQSGAEMEVDGTHGSDSFQYSGGVTVMNGGIVDLDAEMGSLGTGLLTVHEGGQVQGANNSFQNDALFILTSDGDGALQFITGTNHGNGVDSGGWGAGGEWTFDLSSADQTVGNTWQIANASTAIGQTYDTDGLDGDDFSVAGATRDGSGVWTGTSGTTDFTYTESTGVLEITGGGGTPHPGDANGDGWVDVADLGILATNWLQSPRNFSQGNFNEPTDTIVDVADLGILATNWETGPNPPQSSVSAVPEPTSLVLLSLSSLALLARRRR